MADSNPIGGIAIFPGVEAERDATPAISGPNLFEHDKRELFAVLGCISYSYAGDKHGETGFRFMLGQVVDGKVIGVLFREGNPWPTVPISPELLARGFPRESPKEERVSADQFYFKEEDAGNYAK